MSVDAAPQPCEGVKLSVLTQDQALREWDVLAKFFEKGVDRTGGRYDLSDVLHRIKSGVAMVVIVWDAGIPEIYAAFLVEGDEYPGKKVFSIVLAGGADIEVWGHLYPAFLEIARVMGFDQLEVHGRPGWAKFIGAREISRVWIEDL